MFNPAVIIPAIFTSIFMYVGSGLALNNVSHPPSPLPTPNSSAPSVTPPPPSLQPLKYSCAGNGMFITGSVFSFVTFIIYAIATYVLLVYANIVIEIIKTAWGGGAWFDDCLDESRAMFSSAGVGCLIATIGTFGAFVSSICASCRRMLEVPSQPPCCSSLPWPPGADEPGSWLRCALQRAAHNASDAIPPSRTTTLPLSFCLWPFRCGICKHEAKQKQAATAPVQGTQMGNIPVATPVSNTPVAAGQPVC